MARAYLVCRSEWTLTIEIGRHSIPAEGWRNSVRIKISSCAPLMLGDRRVVDMDVRSSRGCLFLVSRTSARCCSQSTSWSRTETHSETRTPVSSRNRTNAWLRHPGESNGRDVQHPAGHRDVHPVGGKLLDQPESHSGRTFSGAMSAAARFRISFSISCWRLARRGRTSAAPPSSGPRARDAEIDEGERPSGP